MGQEIKTLIWISSAKKEFMAMPDKVQDTFEYAFHLAQTGKKHSLARPFNGSRSVRLLEVVENDLDSTYHAVYMLFHNAVYILHCFQKNARPVSPYPNPAQT